MDQTAAISDQAAHPGPKAVDRQDILGILARHNDDRGGPIAVLEEVQARYGYLPEQALRMVAGETGRSLVDLYGIATFYRCFTLQPRGKHLICVCLGTACHVRAAPRVVEELERQLGLRAGQTTADMQFTLETVNCLGACALGPIVVADGEYSSNVTPADVKDILAKAQAGLPQAECPAAGTSHT